MGDILFLAHRIPFPPNRGDKIRSHHVLKALAKLAPVHVGCLAENAADRAQEHELAAVAESHCLADRKGALPLDGFRALATGRPVSEATFGSRKLRRWVQRTLATRQVDAIYVFSGQMTQYLPDRFEGRLVVDFVDVDSAKFEAYAKDGGAMAPIWRREAEKLRALEAEFAARADHALLVTEEEAALFRERLPEGCDADIRVLRNGMDTVLFDPARVKVNPLVGKEIPRLIFTGQMDYPPNVAAAERLAKRIHPLLREEVSVHIVGRDPTPEVRALESEHVCVWGAVADIRDYLWGADIAVIPLEVARGVQNKVLEAMAMGLPCVLSEGAATGIPAQDGRDFAIARSDEEFAATIDRLAVDLPRGREMGSNARRWVVEHASWESALAALPGLMGREAPA